MVVVDIKLLLEQVRKQVKSFFQFGLKSAKIRKSLLF